ncbi:hypothetical protein EDC30_105164 [Paucimonas lemoignei]|uniref:Uncharacterized protein n=1 Tax=Paucimonas lemoignei TaxID=29443 RepID=A0A4R3HV02_PAULE|nr:hypothetical protein [Paucimonas lemoignei]TCS36942.1 hypothetical protein EDC30_105164 [Paucimonas lemoignei]
MEYQCDEVELQATGMLNEHLHQSEWNDKAMTLGKQPSPLHYSPARLLDALLHHLKLNNDNALSRRLHVTGNVIQAIRHGTMPIGASMLLWMQEVSGLSVHELRQLLGDRRARCRPAHVIRSRRPHR